MNEQEFDLWLDEQASRLAPELPPEKDLWPAIHKRISAGATVTHHHPGAPRGLYALAASAALIALAALFVAVMPRPSSPDPTAVAGPSAIDTGDWLPGVVEVRNEMSIDFDANLDQLAPETRVVVEDNMKKIHESLAEIHAALAEDPGNTTLHRLLMSTYQKELNLMSHISRINTTSTEL